MWIAVFKVKPHSQTLSPSQSLHAADRSYILQVCGSVDLMETQSTQSRVTVETSVTVRASWIDCEHVGCASIIFISGVCDLWPKTADSSCIMATLDISPEPQPQLDMLQRYSVQVSALFDHDSTRCVNLFLLGN